MKKYGIIGVVVVIAGIGAFLLLGQKPQEETTNISQDSTNTTEADVPSDNIYKTATDASKGTYLTDFQGITLYTYDKDTDGVSNCDATCLKTWPRYTSGATAQGIFPKNITVITRSDGDKQFAWKGKPLYYAVSDKNAGDLTGDGVGGQWHIVKP